MASAEPSGVKLLTFSSSKLGWAMEIGGLLSSAAVFVLLNTGVLRGSFGI